MKFTFGLTALLLVTSARADLTRAVCATTPMTTTYALVETADGFRFHAIHHNGVDRMPIHQGIITPHDLPAMAENARILSGLGAKVTYHFLRDECSESLGEWTCVSDRPGRIGEIDVRSVVFRVGSKRVITARGERASVLALFGVRVGSMPYSAPMDYLPGDCILR